jgi:hypothetical protein
MRRSVAARALGFLVPDRWRELQERQEQVAATPRLAAEIEDGVAQLTAMGAVAQGDFVSRGLTDTATPLFAAMTMIAGDKLQRQPDQLIVAGVPDDETLASMMVYPDGSGAVVVSDSLVSLIDYFASLSICLEAQPAETPALATVAIRYHVLHRRLFGLAALLGVTMPAGHEQPRDALSSLALRFVLAHEAAHFCLAHDEHRGDPTIELEADALALETLSAAPSSEVDNGLATALVGMKLAFLATELTEVALFVRRPVTHPPAADRWETATRGLDENLREGVELYTRAITRAIQAAADPLFRLPETWWEQAFSSAVIDTDIHAPGYYESIRHFDRLGFDDPNDPAGLLEMFEQRFGIALTGAAVAAAERSPRAGLVWLGIPADQADLLCDEQRALAFYTLRQAIEHSPAVLAVDEHSLALEAVAQQMISPGEAVDAHTIRLTLSWCIATLIAGIMQGVYGRN